MQKFYLHDATTTLGGTLPGATSVTTATPGVTAAGASTNRTMDGKVGTVQASSALTTLAQLTAQFNWFRRFLSPVLAAQTISQTGWIFHNAASMSSTTSALQVFSGTSAVSTGALVVWRPSTGVVVGRLIDGNSSWWTLAASTAEQAGNGTLTGTAGNVTVRDGDILVFEIWGRNVQSSAMAFTNTVFYDGTTEDSASTNAAYLLAPADVKLLTFHGQQSSLHDDYFSVQAIQQAVSRAAVM